MIVSVIYFVLFFSIFGVVLLLHYLNRPRPLLPVMVTPRVSILIAVRNEAHQVLDCLEAIRHLDYPAGQLEVLIGDDNSTDHTFRVVQDYIAGKPQFQLVPIREQMGAARGKANVLAHLTRLAKTDIFLLTDADIRVPAGWVRFMLTGLGTETGIVTGITTIAGKTLFGRFQALDWLNALGLMQVVSDLGLPVSTMGNNMLITRQAYFSTGGYENLPFSVTEDVQLFRAVIQRGFTFRNIFQPEVLALSAPAPDWQTLLHQRKRWMQGVQHLPWYMNLILVVYASFYAFCLPFFIYTSWPVVAGIFFAKFFIQTLFISSCLRRLNLSVPWFTLILFEFYLIFVTLTALLFFLLPLKVKWKSRNY